MAVDIGYGSMYAHDAEKILDAYREPAKEATEKIDELQNLTSGMKGAIYTIFHKAEVVKKIKEIELLNKKSNGYFGSHESNLKSYHEANVEKLSEIKNKPLIKALL
ncbi:MAG: hypothetical protein RLZZ210_373 [Pseudomonadota bacterium]